MSAINLSCLTLRLLKSLSDISATEIDLLAELENRRAYRVAHSLLILRRGLVRYGANAAAVRRMATLLMMVIIKLGDFTTSYVLCRK